MSFDHQAIPFYDVALPQIINIVPKFTKKLTDTNSRRPAECLCLDFSEALHQTSEHHIMQDRAKCNFSAKAFQNIPAEAQV